MNVEWEDTKKNEEKVVVKVHPPPGGITERSRSLESSELGHDDTDKHGIEDKVQRNEKNDDNTDAANNGNRQKKTEKQKTTAMTLMLENKDLLQKKMQGVVEKK